MFNQFFNRIETIKASVSNAPLLVSYQIESMMGDLSASIYENLKLYPQAEVKAEFAKLKELFMDAPFIRRANEWKQGYVGDFETVEYMINGVSEAQPHTFGYQIDYFCLNTVSAQQHRNKVRAQSQKIEETLVRLKKDVRILVVGCGTCPDIRSVKNLIACYDCRFDLVDMDKGALDFAQSKLAEISDKCQFIQANVYKFDLPTDYDLILFGGVFDYLPDKFIVGLLQKCYAKLRQEGQIFFTNIAENNYDKIPREYMMSWTLIERNEDKLQALCALASIKNVHFTREYTRLSVLGTITKAN